jgi:hypothetical protein
MSLLLAIYDGISKYYWLFSGNMKSLSTYSGWHILRRSNSGLRKYIWLYLKYFAVTQAGLKDNETVLNLNNELYLNAKNEYENGRKGR